MLKKMTLLGLLTALASALFAVECLIPNPMPWMRLGLANSLTLLALIWWGWREGLVVLLLRVLIGSLITGRFLQPIFFLSLGGGVAATLVMAACMPLAGRFFSMIGISIVGAMAKNAVQLLLAVLLFTRHGAVWGLAPLFLLSALASGLFIGVLVELIIRRSVFQSALSSIKSP